MGGKRKERSAFVSGVEKPKMFFAHRCIQALKISKRLTMYKVQQQKVYCNILDTNSGTGTKRLFRSVMRTC